MNVRSSSYLIARALATCGTCRATTPVVGLVVPPGHDVLQFEADSPEPGSDADGQHWEATAHGAFLFHIDRLPDRVVTRVAGYAPLFRAGAPDRDGCGPWSNHCASCGCRLDDQDLFCEPEAAFFPVSEPAARAIHLVGIAEPFAAYAAGYAPDPAFFDAMSRA
jgi:hypothetical protein